MKKILKWMVITGLAFNLQVQEIKVPWLLSLIAKSVRIYTSLITLISA